MQTQAPFDPRSRVFVLMAEMSEVNPDYQRMPHPQRADFPLPGETWSEGGQRAIALIHDRQVRAHALLDNVSERTFAIEQEIGSIQADVHILMGLLEAEFTQRFCTIGKGLTWSIAVAPEFGICVNVSDQSEFEGLSIH